uniref:Cysteine-rich DPF motif domain-containing protein 1 n=1 Tax=Timema bartmani TaxID=61472 RepID=A0A7R9ETI4_9NEOP|nr:unnamed protein product [Timema bartmani]
MEAEPPAQIEGGEFVCSTCGLTEHYTYKGKQPPFCKKISFIDDSYVMKDPFSPPNKNQFLLLGSDCHLCNKQASLNLPAGRTLPITALKCSPYTALFTSVLCARLIQSTAFSTDCPANY